ncbi:hypothetical protein [Mesorhizobium sp.]|uniref:hypothetical protein n=1 Tax=Mesorhizobium sp. TaxID=1871066 RepID=UPI00344D7359
MQGAILRLAQKTGVPAPVTKRIMALVCQAEADRRGPPGLTPDDVSRGPRSA